MEGLKISFPLDVLPLITYVADRKQEHFICMLEYNGFYIVGEGKHRVCIAKRFKIPKVFGIVKKTEYKTIDNGDIMKITGISILKKMK